MTEARSPIDAKTDVYGILGHPVRHSLSPLIHNALFQKLGIHAVYLAFDVAPERLELALEGARSLGIKGLNITVPHKEAALNFVDEVPEDADRNIGAINTVVNKNGVLYGYNTDGPGFLLALREELQVNPQGKSVVVLGAGGAARGVGFSLANAGAERVFIHNRTQDRAMGLAEYLEKHFSETEVHFLESFDLLKREKIDLVVNATAAGLHTGDASPMDLKLFSGQPAVYDLIYGSHETALLKQARQMGLRCADGRGMLAAQAALSFALWTGKTQGVRETMLEMLKK